jgi:ApbE superfamily uncharacterized protein (UPF0280 family)
MRYPPVFNRNVRKFLSPPSWLRLSQNQINNIITTFQTVYYSDNFGRLYDVWIIKDNPTMSDAVAQSIHEKAAKGKTPEEVQRIMEEEISLRANHLKENGLV